MNDVILGLVRHALTTLGGAGVVAGAELENVAAAITSGIVAAVGFAWSLYKNRKAK